MLRERDLSKPPSHLAKYWMHEGWRELLALGFAHGAELSPRHSSSLSAQRCKSTAVPMVLCSGPRGL